MTEPPAPLAHVVGQNARALRGKYRADDVARAATAVGLNWGTGRVADLEAGRVSPTLPTLLALCQAFGDLLGRRIALADLLAGDGRVIVTDDLTPRLAEVRAVIGQAPVAFDQSATPSNEQLVAEYLANRPESFSSVGPKRRAELWRIWQSYGETEERAARSLGVDKGDLVAAMAELWGHTLSVERDRQAGPDATPQKRGRIARELKTDLKTVLDGDN